jgi:hypothetical protein
LKAEDQISRVEVVFVSTGDSIGQIILYDRQSKVLLKIGSDYFATGRNETFKIEENERLIGCELEHSVT